MSLATYTDLLASAATWIKRSDLTSIIPDFVKLAEARINRELRTRSQVVRASNASVDSEFVTVPTDFGGVRSIRLTARPYRQLQYQSPEQMADYAATAPTGDLVAFSVVGGEFWFLPVQSTAVTVQLTYYAKVPALSVSATTNWLLTAHPDVYLWGVLLEASVYLEDDEATQKYAAMFAQSLQDIRANSVADSLGANISPLPGVFAV